MKTMKWILPANDQPHMQVAFHVPVSWRLTCGFKAFQRSSVPSIHSFIHVANIYSNLLCAGHHDSPWRYKGKRNTLCLPQKHISNCYRFSPTNHRKVQKPRIFSIYGVFESKPSYLEQFTCLLLSTYWLC